MQQETLCARVKGLREGGSTMDTQMCSSLKPVEVRLWKIFLEETKVETLSPQFSRGILNATIRWTPEAGDLVALRRIERFLGAAVPALAAQPAVAQEVPHLTRLEVLYGHLVDVPVQRKR